VLIAGILVRRQAPLPDEVTLDTPHLPAREHSF
jgi:hypothetical protein